MELHLARRSRPAWRAGARQHVSIFVVEWTKGLEFADYTFDQHFKQPIPSFPPREVLYDYITGRAKDGDLKKYIQFNTAVRHVAYDKASGKFSVTVEHLPDRKLGTDTFDWVVVATGHFSVPNVPHFPESSRSPDASCMHTTSAAPTSSRARTC